MTTSFAQGSLLSFLAEVPDPRSRHGRQLQHGRRLAPLQKRQEHGLPIGKLERIMKCPHDISVDLSEYGHGLACTLIRPEAFPLHLAVESELCSRLQAYCHPRFVHGCKAARKSSKKAGGNQSVTDLGGPRGDVFHTIVAHGGNPFRGNIWFPAAHKPLKTWSADWFRDGAANNRIHINS